jgi:hypothetical protein
MSPVVASIYCSPHPAALQIAPAARLRGFASMIPRPENSFAIALIFSRLTMSANLHGNPYLITSFPTPASVTGYQKSVPDGN